MKRRNFLASVAALFAVPKSLQAPPSGIRNPEPVTPNGFDPREYRGDFQWKSTGPIDDFLTKEAGRMGPHIHLQTYHRSPWAGLIKQTPNT